MLLKDVERSEFSQNGEDGIIEHLTSRLVSCSNRFVEIGCGDGGENNTTALARKGWTGVVFDRKSVRIERYRKMRLSGVDAYCMTVIPDATMEYVVKRVIARPCDVFSLDIDSCDFQVMRRLLKRGFRPKIAVLEYNATYGMRPVYTPWPAGRSVKDVYYGAGVGAWNKLMGAYGYSFVTVDSAGTNAVYLRDGVGTCEIEDRLSWVDNAHMVKRFGVAEYRFSFLEGLELEVA